MKCVTIPSKNPFGNYSIHLITFIDPIQKNLKPDGLQLNVEYKEYFSFIVRELTS